VAMAKIVLRIMGLSWFFVGCALHILPVSRASDPPGSMVPRQKTRAKILGAREGPLTSLREADVFRPAGAGTRLSLPFGLCRKAALDRERRRRGLPR